MQGSGSVREDIMDTKNCADIFDTCQLLQFVYDLNAFLISALLFHCKLVNNFTLTCFWNTFCRVVMCTMIHFLGEKVPKAKPISKGPHNISYHLWHQPFKLTQLFSISFLAQRDCIIFGRSAVFVLSVKEK